MNTRYALILSLLLSGAPLANAHTNPQNPQCENCDKDKDNPRRMAKRSVAVSCEETPENPVCGNPEPAVGDEQPKTQPDNPSCLCNKPKPGQPRIQPDNACCNCSKPKPSGTPARTQEEAEKEKQAEAQQTKMNHEMPCQTHCSAMNADATVVAIMAEESSKHHAPKQAAMCPSCGDCPKEPKDQQ